MFRRTLETTLGLRRLRFSSFKFDFSKSMPSTATLAGLLNRLFKTTGFLPDVPVWNHNVIERAMPVEGGEALCAPRQGPNK
jgi:hypothetical protein